MAKIIFKASSLIQLPKIWSWNRGFLALNKMYYLVYFVMLSVEFHEAAP